MNQKELKELVEFLIEKDITEFELERGDVKEAVRQYTRYLKLAPADQLAISPGRDSWLLMALKDARAKEKNHVRSEAN